MKLAALGAISHHIGMKTYALATLGCKVNQYEGEMVSRQLSRFKNVSFTETADAYIINTCGVTAEAEAKARQLIGKAKRASAGAVIVLTGCWTAADADRWRELGVDILVPNDDKERLAALLAEGIENISNGDSPGLAPEVSPKPTASAPRRRTRSFIKVQDGCDEHCAYCAIPTFRGELKSRPIDDIVAELNAMPPASAHEVVLTGIHLGKYGVDDSGRPRLFRLLHSILERTDIRRIRLSSIEPQEISDPLIELMANEPRMARHLHIPLQSGSDRILAAMNRRYVSGDFLELVEKIRGRMPDAGITTDMIVGFPGESDDDARATLDFVRQARFSRLHVFKFSARPGTAAAKLAGRVEPKIVKARAADLKAVGVRQASIFAAGFIGRRVSVLVEKKTSTMSTGLTSQYVRVKWEQPICKTGEIVEMTGVRADDEILLVALPDD